MARLLYFASLSETMGCREESLELDPSWTVNRLLNSLEARVPALQAMRGRYRVAVDQKMVASEEFILGGAAEIALIPPVSGGGGPWVRLDYEPILSDLVLEAVRRPDCGAVLLFLGCVRDSFQDQLVERIDYSAYESMALAELKGLAEESLARLGEPSAVAVWHRLGPVAAGQASVAVAVATPHRRAAYAEGQWLIDALKARVPIWKKEIGPDGAVWIEGDARLPAP
ncbi:MAG: molybdenum cofactor biosynthesis protein MoaE [Candidatus Eremiobacteraeota bacterium]|nr:molybdenum cofactor biosynthesis protein MoaE [Candidatus Eremiobacteraeota bacterium]